MTDDTDRSHTVDDTRHHSMRPLKLLVLAPDPSLAGGVGQFVRSEIAHLSSATIAGTFVIGRRPTDRHWLQTISRPIVDCIRLIARLRRDPPDVIQVNPSMAVKSVIRDGMFLLSIRLAFPGAVVVFFHGWDTKLADAILNSVVRRRLFCSAYGRANHIYLLADVFKTQLSALGLPADIMEVTSTMFDATDLSCNLPSAPISSRRPRRLLYMGRVVAEKGIYELIDAFQDVRAYFHDLELIIAGNGRELHAVRNRLELLGLQGYVHLPGFVSGATKAMCFSSSDIFVLPSRHPEGCPVALLEAMAMGLPVIASSVGGVPKIIVNGSNGILLSTSTRETIAAAITTLLLDPNQLVSIGERNRDEAWRKYDSRAITKSIEQTFRIIAQR